MSVAEPPSVTPLPVHAPGSGPPSGRPRIKRLRLALLVLGLSVLALVSTVFGMMMAVASNLGDLASDKRFKNAANSILEDARGRQVGVLVNNQNLVFVTYDEIAPAMRNAIIAVEDRRFFTNSGIDLRGIGRAFVNDVFGSGATQGGSTITQQFVKNAENQQRNRTVFAKLREAAMAYHLTRRWKKEKILTQYLNTIYFGNGAYGVESAARIYFGDVHPGCGTRGQPKCASVLRPEEAALLAGIVSNPSGYDPQTRWPAAMARRNLVLRKMLEQGYIDQTAYQEAVRQTAPPVVQPPADTTAVPDPTDPSRNLNVGYFNNWVRQQLVDRYGAQKAFRSGWRVRTTLDIDLQAAAERAVRTYLSTPRGPTASMVVLNNEDGAVRAMVGGFDYANKPFNLATQGQRQPGSAFKPFVLAAALREGISPGSTWSSRRKVFSVPGTKGREKFVVNNYGDNYSGVTTLANATTFSDNSVYAEVGYRTGFRNIARTARRMGIRTPISTNPAITLGGLQQGVTVLDMAHAYETLATGGRRVGGTLGQRGGGPVGIRLIRDAKGNDLYENKTVDKRVLSPELARTETAILQSVVARGTGTKAQYGGFAAGKTGTTENYGDAWFVGFTEKYTVAVWVGYPDSVKPMAHDYAGAAVSGGTYPAQIWRAFVLAAQQIDRRRAIEEALKRGGDPSALTTSTTPDGGLAPGTGSDTPSPPVASGATPPAAGGRGAASGGGKADSTPAPAPAPTPTPAPAPAAPPPSSGGDSGTSTGTGGASSSGGAAAPPPDGSG